MRAYPVVNALLTAHFHATRAVVTPILREETEELEAQRRELLDQRYAAREKREAAR